MGRKIHRCIPSRKVLQSHTTFLPRIREPPFLSDNRHPDSLKTPRNFILSGPSNRPAAQTPQTANKRHVGNSERLEKTIATAPGGPLGYLKEALFSRLNIYWRNNSKRDFSKAVPKFRFKPDVPPTGGLQSGRNLIKRMFW
jgi:hypothetical protein